MKKIVIFVSALLLSACGAADNDPGPGGVSVGEARALDEAAEMIEAKRLPAQQAGEAETAQAEDSQDSDGPPES
ncbi:hypothetical protein GCM10023115_06680 [Pontixanthobacter gangjinensis]|uniref:Lipoprotein n=1 Tax=Pontixanthobacter gangjinensis TaxID=1028742 RepID=A0A6I4SM61_9SPHN|nr:hypothetical protein [Pontixanthobacter gangjinensis]MXO55917.1 hypothetical protein [Pontixanthobacter gangjinensis]